ncbi:MAG: hypothetical protein ABFC89_02875 [Methanospirillum sp.]
MLPANAGGSALPRLALLVLASLIAVGLAGTVTAADPRNLSLAATYLEQVRDDPAQLYAFFHAMPKGGDLHAHLSGTVATEDLIAIGAGHGVWVDPATGVASANRTSPAQVPVADALANQTLYASLVRAWSMAGYDPAAGPGTDRFFGVFGRIGAVSQFTPDLIRAVRNETAGTGCDYIELQWKDKKYQGRVSALAAGLNANATDLAGLHRALIAAGLNGTVDAIVADTEEIMTAAGGADNGNLSVRLIWEANRNVAPADTFAQLAVGFEVARRSPYVVGVNLVSPEGDYASREYYSLHMAMLSYLHALYPDVPIALHAGEYAPGLVPYPDLRYHVRSAVADGHASRIGHGTDILYEDDPYGTMARMRDERVPVELLLTSNAQTLGVEGLRHPAPVYLAAGVPIVLSTDDGGIERTDLAQEYTRLAAEYPSFDYRALRTIARNSLEFSFLDGESLYLDGDYERINPALRGETPGGAVGSAAARAFLAGNPRAAAEWRLEGELDRFEAEIAARSHALDITTPSDPFGSLVAFFAHALG